MPENKTSETSSDLPAQTGIFYLHLFQKLRTQDDNPAVIFKKLKGITKKLEQLEKKREKTIKNKIEIQWK
jgi:hypothetical protein